MRAIQYDQYGSPDVLHETDAPRPTPRHGEVLVRVHATSVNPIESRVRSGQFRVITGFRFPKGTGMDFAGEIEELGDGVADFAAGDRVWGFLGGLPNHTTGAAAEFVVAKATGIAAAPKGDLEQLAALPVVGVSALLSLREHAHLAAGERLLVRGGGGGIGSVAVQYGKHLGAHVTALVGARNLEFVRGIGANAALDYSTNGPAQLGRFDVILDLTGRSMGRYRSLLARGGRMVSPALLGLPYMAWSLVHGPRRVRPVFARPTARLLGDLAGLVDSGAIRPIVDTVHPFANAAEAHRTSEARTGHGKQVISVLG